ncbi:MAG: hypothetical protein RL091_2285 [Verrucomicrobiota bacterium]
MTAPRPINLRPFLWVPSLYLAMGIPFNIIMGGTAARMYKSLGYSDGQITVALGSIGVAWSLKPLWAALLDMYGTKKFFVLAMEVLLAGLLVAVAMTLPTTGFFRASIALFWIAAFASSTQDICADGIYLTALRKPEQARLAGLQSTFWVLGKVLASGVLISVLDRIKLAEGWPEQKMWVMVMVACAGVMGLLAALHAFTLPAGRPARRPAGVRQVVTEFRETAVSFFHKRMFWGMIGFVFLYRLGEGLILMEGQLFLQSAVSQGGLGLTAGQVSDIDALWGTLATIIGGLLGGVFVSRHGLARTLVVLALFLNVPSFAYVYLSQAASAGHGLDYATIATLVSIEKFGYGFGFIGNMIYMMQQLAPGRCTMTHYAFATALMNLVMVPTNMISGPLAEALGFAPFFIVVMVASVPSVWAAWRAPYPAEPAGADAAGTAPDELNSITPDDPSRLDDTARRVQVLAGRASIYAMLNILAILLIDSKALGLLQEDGPGRIPLGLLAASLGAKLFFSHRAWCIARETETEAGRTQERIYVRNARGARTVTILCGVTSCAILALTLKLAL